MKLNEIKLPGIWKARGEEAYTEMLNARRKDQLKMIKKDLPQLRKAVEGTQFEVQSHISTDIADNAEIRISVPNTRGYWSVYSSDDNWIVIAKLGKKDIPWGSKTAQEVIEALKKIDTKVNSKPAEYTIWLTTRELKIARKEFKLLKKDFPELTMEYNPGGSSGGPGDGEPYTFMGPHNALEELVKNLGFEHADEHDIEDRRS